MKKSAFNLSLLQSLLVTCTVISPILVVKIVEFTVLDFNITFPSSAILYAVVFMLSNAISELYDETQAKQTVKISFMCQFLAAVVFMLIRFIPTQDEEIQSAYQIILGSNILFTLSSFIAYLISQYSNIVIYSFERRFLSKLPSWCASFISMLFGQAIDTFAFLGISYGLFLKWFFDSETLQALWMLMLGQYIVRTLIAVVEIPVFKAMVKSSS